MMIDRNRRSSLLGKIAAYTEILVKDPRSTIFVSLAETYRKMGMFEDSRQIIAKGLELHPDFSPAHIVLARVLCQIEEFEASATAFKYALDLDSQSLAALVGYARVQILLGQESEARELLLSARELSPADPIINKLLLSLPEQEPVLDDENIEEHVPEGVSEISSEPLISATLAELYLKQGLRHEALKVYQDLSTQSPNDLDLRRKIKELENDITVADSFSNNLDSNNEPNDSVQGFSRKEPDIDGMIEVDEASVQPEIQLSPEESILETLNQWLSNIEKRRGHV
jgi:tetratricopeptide (TPR) repeat protein